MSTAHSGLRYTLRGSPNVERHIGATIARAAGLVAKSFPRHDYRALVLLGGYGRGEGGVIRDRGEERPHNNLDFLLITPMLGALRQTALKKKLDDVLAPIVRDEGIGIDTGVISEFELRRAPGRVIWFDLRWGHRTILGDAALIPSLDPLVANDIEMDDVHHLLVNRASLLVINDAVVERGITSDLHARFILKHLMKSIIGHGDAFLFTRGRYHASYLEKQLRMREFSSVVPGLAELYEMAAEFRFEPNYDRPIRSDLAPFAMHVRHVLARVHLEFERFRSGNPRCTFAGHVERVLCNHQESNSFPIDPKQFYRMWKYGRHGHVDPSLSPTIAKAIRQSHPRKVLAAALPAVLHGSNNDEMRLVQRILGADACTTHALRQAYLRYWATHGDPNFHTTAQRLGLSFESTRNLS
jgi:hypothetical protein